MSNNNLDDDNNISNDKCYICLEIINNVIIHNLNPCKCTNMKICIKCLPKYIKEFGKNCTVCKYKLVFTKNEKLALNIKRRKKDKKRKKGHIKKRTKGNRNSKNKGIRRKYQHRNQDFLLLFNE